MLLFVFQTLLLFAFVEERPSEGSHILRQFPLPSILFDIFSDERMNIMMSASLIIMAYVWKIELFQAEN